MNFKRLLLPMLILFIFPVLFVPILSDMFGLKTSASYSNSNKIIKQVPINQQVEEILTEERLDDNTSELNFVKKQNPFKYVATPADRKIEVVTGEGKVDKTNPPSQTTVVNQNTPELKTQVVEKSTSETFTSPNSNYSYTDEEFEILADLVSIEAKNDNLETKIGLAAVVLNRIDSESFPNTIKEIVYSKNQFLNTTIANIGKVTPTEDDYLAVVEALNGEDPTLGAEYYYSKNIIEYSAWHEKDLYLTKQLGQFRFFSLEKSVEKPVEKDTKINIVKQEAKVEVSKPTVSNANENVDSSIKNDKVKEVKTLDNASKGSFVEHTEEEFEMLAKIIWAEARGESYEGKVAVGAVILNRLKDPKYPNSIKEIIFAPKQFEPVSNGMFLKAKPTTEEYLAAVEAFNGVDPTMGATSFYAPSLVISKWHESLTYTTTIGVHRFFK